MNTPATAKTIATTLKTAELSAERERASALAAAYDGLLAAAQDLTGALEEENATIAGCATEIAALKALYPEEEEES